MTLNEFARDVTLREGGKKSVSAAQIKEILKIVDTLTFGELYKLIRKKER